MRTFPTIIGAALYLRLVKADPASTPPMDVLRAQTTYPAYALFCAGFNGPSDTPPTTCAESTVPITLEICAGSFPEYCTCTTDGNVFCSTTPDPLCPATVLTEVCSNYWGCTCEGYDGLPPCSTPFGCGVGPGHGFLV